MEFNFLTSGNIILKRGSHKELGKYVKGMGVCALLLHARSFCGEKLEAVKASLGECGMNFAEHINPSAEPTANTVDAAADAFRAGGCDMIIAIGGGSVIDTGKAASGIVTNGGNLEEYLEGVGTGRKIVNAPVPFIAVPTTHGTGAEATKNAVISSNEKLYKKSLRDDRLIPKKIIIDAELMTSLPKKITASCSMDALTQLIEAYTSKKANPMTDALALSGLKAAAKSIIEVYDNGENIEARENMAYASLLSGICLANAGLGAVHGFAPAFGITYGISHGESCALLLDHVMRYNIPYALDKYAEIGEILTGKTYPDKLAAANAGVDFVTELKIHMGIPSGIAHLNIKESDINNIVSRISSNSIGANPVAMDKAAAGEFVRGLI